ncbi:putative HTH-type transcriptional regulator [compost metagenome]
MTYKESDETDAQHAKHPIPSQTIGCFRDRLKQAMGRTGGRAFARKCGLSEGAIRSYLSGDTYPTLDRLEQIAHASGVSAIWLAFGIAEPDFEEGTPVAAATALDEDRFALVPLYDVTVSAGHGLLNGEENKLADLAFTRYWLNKAGLRLSQLAAIRVKGDSMEPTIRGGDTILVDMAHTLIQDGQVFVIRDGDTLLVKRLQRKLGGVIRVISDNRLYPEFETAADTLEVVGRAVWKGGLI